MFLSYYFICMLYCIARSYKKWNEQDLGANSMELVMILAIGWILAPIDFALIQYRYYHNRK